MEELVKLKNEFLTKEALTAMLLDAKKLTLSEPVKKQINASRLYLEEVINTTEQPIYGINTGFGSLYKNSITNTNLTILQEKLVKSHACGMGEILPPSLIRTIMLTKIISLSKGFSGVRLSLVERLVDFYNAELYPLVYEQGSLGASGDLAPLAHLALGLMGEGLVYYKGEIMPSKKAHEMLGWQPLSFAVKEGLALLNGTQFMSAYGLKCIIEAERILKLADLIGTMSLEAFDCRSEPFSEEIHRIRPHIGQIETAKRIRTLLEGSQMQAHEKRHVQDPYSFRCIPQVHGASKDALKHVTHTFITEINGVTDNPNIFYKEEKILSGGNFHGQPLALTLDYLGLALAEIGSISERRTYQLVSGQRGLPEFLIEHPGLNSGLMIPQYTAASIISQNKQLATPASVDSIVSSNGQEDHVSMGANAATKTLKIMENVYKVLGIELLTAAQSFEFRRPLESSPVIEQLYQKFRGEVAPLREDRILHDDMVKATHFIKTLNLETN